MKVQVRPSFDSDLDRYGLSAEESQELADFHEALAAGPLPRHYGEHELIGDWAGYLECHLADDWLVIYKRFRDRVVLYRTGTHKELFDHVLKR